MFIKSSRSIFSSYRKAFFLRNSSCKMSNTSEVILEEVKEAGVVTLNRPKALNALNLNMVRLIYPKLKEWESKKRLVIIKGSGEKAFCAGGDIKSVTESGKAGGTLPRDFFKEEYILNCLIGTYHIPYIAVIHGITMGGGVGLSIHGRFRIGTEKTVFAMPETGIGLFPDVGGSYFLPRLGGNLGFYLALTGYRLKGRDVLRAGIATHCCESSALDDLVKTLTEEPIIYEEDVSNVLNKFSSAATFGKDEEFSLKPFLQQIRKCFGGNNVEDVIKNLEADGSEWAKKQLDILSKMSPTSLKITFEALKRGEHATLQECLINEYRLSQRCCEDNDFYEGVRALLVDKDNNPKWKPNSLGGVTNQTLDRYFSPLPPDRELTF